MTVADVDDKYAFTIGTFCHFRRCQGSEYGGRTGIRHRAASNGALKRGKAGAFTRNSSIKPGGRIAVAFGEQPFPQAKTTFSVSRVGVYAVILCRRHNKRGGRGVLRFQAGATSIPEENRREIREHIPWGIAEALLP